MNTLQKQFSDALKREKKFVTTYYTNETVPCLFRKIDDYKNTSNHIEIFYDIDSPIKQGQIITYGDKAFIVINKESVENDIYYKSVIKKCNLTIPVTIDGVVRQIPCYSYELNSAYTMNNKIITPVDGRGEIITELTPELSNTNYINKGLRVMGGYYEVVNMYNLDGIVHLMIERGLAPDDTYSLALSSDATSYIEGKTTQLTTNTLINDIPDTTATISYSTSDETIAIVDDNGLVTFIGVGSVSIIATWVERALTKTLVFTVISNPDTPIYTLTLTSSDPNNYIIMEGGATTITAKLTDSDDNEIDFTPIWTFDLGDVDENDFKSDFTITGVDTKAISISLDYFNWLYGGVDFKVICTTDDELYTNSIVMYVGM